MRLFFGKINNNDVLIDSEDQKHILRVLRMKDGDEISVTDGMGTLARGRIKINRNTVFFDPFEINCKPNPFAQKTHIAIAPTKNIDRIEFFVEKATEMGISEISFLITEKTERKNINIDKIRKQSLASCKQSLRIHVPKINDLKTFSDFLKHIEPEKTFVAHCHSDFEKEDLKNMDIKNDVTFLIGPEGDFSVKEIKNLTEKKIRMISLGNQRLRTETAGIFISAWSYMKNM